MYETIYTTATKPFIDLACSLVFYVVSWKENRGCIDYITWTEFPNDFSYKPFVRKFTNQIKLHTNEHSYWFFIQTICKKIYYFCVEDEVSICNISIWKHFVCKMKPRQCQISAWWNSLICATAMTISIQKKTKSNITLSKF